MFVRRGILHRECKIMSVKIGLKDSYRKDSYPERLISFEPLIVQKLPSRSLKVYNCVISGRARISISSLARTEKRRTERTKSRI